MNGTRCIFLGGPLNGRFMRVPDEIQTFVCPVKSKESFSIDPRPFAESSIIENYYHRTRDHVFVHESETDDPRAIIPDPIFILPPD